MFILAIVVASLKGVPFLHDGMLLLTQSRHEALASGRKAHNMMLKDFGS